MRRPIHLEVTASHLQRDAYVYVRQATVQQGTDGAEIAGCQYRLRKQALALGWTVEQIHVIDSDLGKSGASSVDREGFQGLLAEVGKGRAGIVLTPDVSRLTRSFSEGHRLLESCARTDTLLFVDDRLYGPGDLRDQFVLAGATSDMAPDTAATLRRGDLCEVPA